MQHSVPRERHRAAPLRCHPGPYAAFLHKPRRCRAIHDATTPYRPTARSGTLQAITPRRRYPEPHRRTPAQNPLHLTLTRERTRRHPHQATGLAPRRLPARQRRAVRLADRSHRGTDGAIRAGGAHAGRGGVWGSHCCNCHGWTLLFCRNGRNLGSRTRWRTPS